MDTVLSFIMDITEEDFIEGQNTFIAQCNDTINAENTTREEQKQLIPYINSTQLLFKLYPTAMQAGAILQSLDELTLSPHKFGLITPQIQKENKDE